jgi:hypothetical protein
MPPKPRSDPFARVRTAAAHLPEVEESTSYGTPSLKVRGKSFARLKDADTLVVMCAVEEKEMLMEVDPKVYFETDHYKGWPAVLVRLKTISASQLRHRLEQAWRFRAPKRLVTELDRNR